MKIVVRDQGLGIRGEITRVKYSLAPSYYLLTTKMGMRK